MFPSGQGLPESVHTILTFELKVCDVVAYQDVEPSIWIFRGMFRGQDVGTSLTTV